MADRGRPKRVCGDCGAALSIYSDEDRCAPCQRRFLDLYRSWPPIPAQVWADREVRDALAGWDFGTVARLVRRRAGLRQEEVAELTGLSQGFLSQLESGRSQLVNIHKIIGFLDGLDTPTDLRPRPGHRRTDNVERDRQADEPAATGLQPPVAPGDALEPLAQVTDLAQIAERVRWLRATNVDDDSLEQFHAVVRGVAEVYEDTGARGLYDLVLRHRHDVDDLMRGHHAPVHRAELLVIAGRLTILLGHLAFDLSSDTLAGAYNSEAWTIGDLCGDHGLQASARSAQSFMAYYRGDYQDAAAYAADAARYAGSRPEAVEAAIHQARAHARLGDRDSVDRAVGHAFEFRSSLSEPDAPHPFLAFEPYDTARIAGNAATAYLSLGAVDRVVEYADSALPALAASGSRAGQALTRLDAASAHLVGDAPDPERTANEVAHAVETAGELRSTVIAQRAREFVHTAERWRPSPAIRDATEQVRDWMSPGAAVEDPQA